MDLYRQILQRFTSPRATVLDLFSGTGALAHACVLEGRHCVSVDSDPKAVENISQRITKLIASLSNPNRSQGKNKATPQTTAKSPRGTASSSTQLNRSKASKTARSHSTQSATTQSASIPSSLPVEKSTTSSVPVPEKAVEVSIFHSLCRCLE